MDHGQDLSEAQQIISQTRISGRLNAGHRFWLSHNLAGFCDVSYLRKGGVDELSMPEVWTGRRNVKAASSCYALLRNLGSCQAAEK